MLLPSLPLILAASAQAAPFHQMFTSRKAPVSARDATNGTVIMCTEVNYEGQCINQTVPLAYDSCFQLATPWLYNTSSFQPRPGTVCWLQRSQNCSDTCSSSSGCSKIVEYPGYANLSTYGYPPWTDNIGSISCEEDFANPG